MTIKRIALTLCQVMVLSTGAAGQPEKTYLTGFEIKQLLTGARLAGKNSFGTFIVHFGINGNLTIKGSALMGSSDSGTWWVEGNKYCRNWSWLSIGKERCLNVSLNGDEVGFWTADGRANRPGYSYRLMR